jgi:hypothetical protein
MGRWLCAALAVGLFGCREQRAARLDLDAAAPCAASPPTGDLPCDVARVLQARCWPCHQEPPRNHAPFSELTYEDLQQPFSRTGLTRWQRMSEVIEPGGAPHMPPRDQPQPTDDELAILRAWFAACAPPAREGDGCDLEDGGAAD